MNPINSIWYSGRVVSDAVPGRTAKGAPTASFDVVQERTAPDGTKVEKVVPFYAGGDVAPEVLKLVKEHERITIQGRLSSNNAGLVIIVDSFEIAR
jgi:hypothetical protein